MPSDATLVFYRLGATFTEQRQRRKPNLISQSSVEMRNIPLPPPSNEVVEYVRASTGVNENRIKEAVKILKDWLKLQPHLPHDYGKFFQTLLH